MSYQVLARKYRPQKFSEVIGQDHVTRTLKNALEQGRTAHGYIFSGHRGIGKTTVARILAMALNCRSAEKPVSEPCGVCDSCTEIRAGNSVDVIEIDAATNRGIDEIRELREAARYRPARDRYKIYILDEAHQITDAAFNALLKTLEEPPGHVVFMLATTQPEDIPQTIRSRCQNFSFHAVKFEDTLRQIRDIVEKEQLSDRGSHHYRVVDPDALALIAEAGDGSVRDALSILDQAIASSEGTLTADTVRQLVGAAASTSLEQMMQAVAESDSQQVLQLVDKLISEGHSPVHFARQMARFLRNTLVAKVAGPNSELLQVSSDERQRAARVAELFSEEDLSRHLQIILRTHSELGYRQEQRFHLELGLLKMAHAQRLLPIEQLLSEAAISPPVSGRNAAPSAPAVQQPLRRTQDAPRSVSPFSADSARKGGYGRSEMSGTSGPRPVPNPTVIMGSAVPAPVAASQPQADPEEIPTAATVTQPDIAAQDLGAQIAGEVEGAGHAVAASLLSSGTWSFEGTQPMVKVAASEGGIKLTFGPAPMKVANAAASSALGRPAKLKIISGGQANGPQRGNGAPRAAGRSKSRAAQDPIVKRLQEKFGAEIRTVIDYQDKR